jgi:two-component system CheB/CheR fusion protein
MSVSIPAELSHSGEAGKPRSLRIFLVEDHDDTRKWMGICLEEMGHTIARVATMAEAIKDIPSAECDVRLREIGLPDGNGSDLLPRLA